MNDLTIFPADLAAMSSAQLVALPITEFVDAERNVDEAVAYLKQLRNKLDAAKLQRFGELARAALRESGRDFGTAHISDGPLHIKFELPKKVSWNQKQLGEIADASRGLLEIMTHNQFRDFWELCQHFHRKTFAVAFVE